MESQPENPNPNPLQTDQYNNGAQDSSNPNHPHCQNLNSPAPTTQNQQNHTSNEPPLPTGLESHTSFCCVHPHPIVGCKSLRTAVVSPNDYLPHAGYVSVLPAVEHEQHLAKDYLPHAGYEFSSINVECGADPVVCTPPAGMRDTNGTEPPLVSTSPTPSVLINNSVGQPLPNKILQRRKRRTRRIVKTARCEISDTACCNNHELDKQKVGKKLEKLKVQEESSSSPQEAGDTKMPVQSLRCEICDISCSSKVSLEHHDVGSKHTKMLKKLKEQQELSKNPQEAGEHRRTVPSIRCELCNITCNNTLLLDGHNVGKKHMKKLEKLNKQQLLSNSPQKANDGDAQSKTNNGNAEVVIDPQENLSSVCDDTEQQQLQKKRVISEELPGKKKRKVMKVGVPQENDERVCGMCNVTCSSQNMMDLHLAGKKHFVTLKRFCGLCNVTCNSQNMMELHLAGKKHSASLKKIHAAEATSSIHAAEDAAYSPSPHQGQVGCCMNTDH